MTPKSSVAHKFRLNPESLKRRFAVYVVLAKGRRNTKLYVGKTGDNREGCNPVISRCGNHFSYNKAQSQIRNKILDHEHRDYTYIFDHFDEYYDDIEKRRQAIDRINEMERWLNEEVHKAIAGRKRCKALTPVSGSGHVASSERDKRLAFRTSEARLKVMGIVAAMRQELGNCQ
jgi:hypothetical protein